MWICYIVITDRTIFVSHQNRVKTGISIGAMHLKVAIMVVWKMGGGKNNGSSLP